MCAARPGRWTAAGPRSKEAPGPAGTPSRPPRGRGPSRGCSAPTSAAEPLGSGPAPAPQVDTTQRGDVSRSSWTLPLTFTVTVALPASVGKAESASAFTIRMAIIGRGGEASSLAMLISPTT